MEKKKKIDNSKNVVKAPAVKHPAKVKAATYNPFVPQRPKYVANPGAPGFKSF